MNDILKLIISLLMAIFITKTTALPSLEVAVMKNEPAKECLCKYPWQHAYAEYINELGYYSGLYIDDINGDEIPEVVIDINTLGSTIVLYYTDSGMQELNLQTVSDWGSVTYIPDTKQFLYSPFYGHTTGTWGYKEYYLYDWTGTEYIQTFSMLRESGYYWDKETYEYGESSINGEETDNAGFEAKLTEIEKLRDENSGSLQFWYLQEEGFEENVRELLPCFEMPDWGE
ncbi:MAG: hypothetical protein HDQ97_11320 [Lachnospiraceae bacterium]|nr:hypothetical protein [Lachnospiraceae bacterium]